MAGTLPRQNRSGLFYWEGTLTANYVDNTFKLLFTSRVIRIIAASADMQFSLIGGNAGAPEDLDGVVKSGENIEFTGMETSKIALRGAGSVCRVWAY